MTDRPRHMQKNSIKYFKEKNVDKTHKYLNIFRRASKEIKKYNKSTKIQQRDK